MNKLSLLILNKLSFISQSLCNLSYFKTRPHVSCWYYAVCVLLHSWQPENLDHLPALGLFWYRISDGRATGVACIPQSNAWHSITAHASAGSSYLGHTQSPSGSGVHRGSSQASVLVNASIQREGGDRRWAPTGPFGRKKSLVPLTSSRPARVGGGPLTPCCVTDEQSVFPTSPANHLCFSESCTHFSSGSPLMSAMLHVPLGEQLPARLFSDEAPKPSWAQHAIDKHTYCTHTHFTVGPSRPQSGWTV